MKRWLVFGGIVVLLLASAWVAGASVGFELPWFSVDAGGGEGSGGSYTMVGSIGQPDAGQLNGDSYTLSGGYIAVTQLDTIPSPSLPHQVFLPITIR